MKNAWNRFRAFQKRTRRQAKQALKESGLLRVLAIYALVSPFVVNPLAVGAGLGYLPAWIPVVGWTLGHLNAWVVLPTLLALHMRGQAAREVDEVARLLQEASGPQRRHGHLRFLNRPPTRS